MTRSRIGKPLEKRTAEIIMICKGKHEFGEGSYKELIRRYMSDRYEFPEENYREELIDRIIREAAYDFAENLTSCTLKDFFKEAEESMYITGNDDFSIAICNAFAAVDVFIDGSYVNGFTEENIKVVK